VATALTTHGFTTAPARRLAHRFRRPRPPPRAGFKRSTPPRELPFSSSAPSPPLRHHATVTMRPSLSHREMPPRSHSELLVTAPSSAPMPGATRTTLSALSTATPLHHRRSTPAEPSHCGQPAPTILRPSQPPPKHHTAEYILPNCSDPAGDPYSILPSSLPRCQSPPPQRSLPMSSSPLFGHQTGLSPCWLAPRPLHRRPSAGRCRRGRRPPLLRPRAKRLHEVGREGRGQMALAHSNSVLFLFSELIKHSIQI
jgi:hypothetical protein